MKTIQLGIFPALAGKKAAFLNLNDCAAAAKYQPARSSFLTPALTDRALRMAHKKLGVDYSLGGYLEDRRDLWRGSYLKPESAVHLGIDVNVAAGTGVCVTRPCRVAKVVHDPDQKGGWGTAVIFALDEPVGAITHFIYAHLGRHSLTVDEGDDVAPGHVIGFLGAPHENGGWYEHLHVQVATREAWDLFRGDLAKIDGYAAWPAGAEHPLFPDPMPLLS